MRALGRRRVGRGSLPALWIVGFVLGLVLAATPAFARLPGDVVPRRYRITLAPDLATGALRGDEQIDVDVVRATPAIVIHDVELEIVGARVTAGSRTDEATVALDAKAQTATLTLPRALAPGPATLALAFRGSLSRRLRGLYLAHAHGQAYALTQFEDVDARRAFPCFDEPAYKAHFTLTAIIPAGLAAISNTPIAHRILQSGGDPGGATERVEFGETLPMSSYLVALAVGPFSPRTLLGGASGRVPITVWAPAGDEALTGFALASAARLLPRFEAWFGVPYPWGKLDLIAAPEFMYGGMENVGAIVFKEAALLVDEARATPAARRRVVEILGHEIAHQWFGDLVTMAWWDDVWLNESFATWIEKKIVDAGWPEWRVWRDFTAQRADTLAVDELAAAHPVRLAATGLGDAEEPETSPTIIYGKGAAVLRMLERYLGEDAFQKGVRRYVEAHAFGVTRASDLWSALAAASGKPVPALADRWITQPGHPLVTLTSTCAGGSEVLHAEQERLLASGVASVGSASLWPVPLCRRDGKGETCAVLDTASQSIPTRRPCGVAAVGNAAGAGFYRVRYDAPSLRAILAQPRAALDASERATLLDDQWTLATTGRAPLAAWLDVVHAWRGERDAAVLGVLEHELQWLADNALDDADRPAFARLVREVYAPIYAELGATRRAADDEETERVRALAIEALALLADDRAVQAAATAAFSTYLADPASLAPSLVGAVMHVATRHGDADLYERVLAQFRAAPTPEVRERDLVALSLFSSPALARRTLALTDGDTLRTEEVDRPLHALLAHRETRADAFAFLVAHADVLLHRASPVGQERLADSTAGLCGEREADAAAALFAAHPPPHGHLATALAVETARDCGAARARLAPALKAALAAWPAR